MVRLNQLGISIPARARPALLMPDAQTGELSYRIKSGSIERAVRESEIRGT
jgi:hypothetical protein